MKLAFQVLLGLMILIIIWVISIWLIPGVNEASGIVHPDFPTMQHSGDSLAMSSIHFTMAALFGISTMGVFGLCLLIGVFRRDWFVRIQIGKAISWGTFVYIALFCIVLISYELYTHSGSTDYVLGFPRATSWMLFGFGFAPLSFTLFYIFRFEKWVFDKSDKEKFEEILSRRQKSFSRH